MSNELAWFVVFAALGVGSFVGSWAVYLKTKWELRRELQKNKRILEALDKGHFLRVINDESQKQKEG